MLEIKMKVEGLEEIKEGVRKFPVQGLNEIGNALKKSVLQVQNEAMKRAPVNKSFGGGNLRQSIKTRFGRLWGEVYSGAKYAVYVHEGTRPHVIEVVNKKVLANSRTGQFFGRKVNHPGTLANPFLLKAVQACKDKIQDNFTKAFQNILNLLK